MTQMQTRAKKGKPEGCVKLSQGLQQQGMEAVCLWYRVFPESVRLKPTLSAALDEQSAR